MGSRAAWALGEWPALETFVRGEHMQRRRDVVEEGQGVETCLVLEAVVATQKGRLDEVRQWYRAEWWCRPEVLAVCVAADTIPMLNPTNPPRRAG